MDEKIYFNGYEEQASEWTYLMIQFEKTGEWKFYKKAEEIYAKFYTAHITEILTQTMENYQENI